MLRDVGVGQEVVLSGYYMTLKFDPFYFLKENFITETCTREYVIKGIVSLKTNTVIIYSPYTCIYLLFFLLYTKEYI